MKTISAFRFPLSAFLLAIALPLSAQPAFPTVATNATAGTNPFAVTAWLPPIPFPAEGYYIQPYLTANGREHAFAVGTNSLSETNVTVNSPRNGGTVTNVVTTYTLTTNYLTVTITNGSAVFSTPPTPVTVRVAYEINGLETSTDLVTWVHVGWWCASTNDPQRWFRTNAQGPLTFQLVKITNAP